MALCWWDGDKFNLIESITTVIVVVSNEDWIIAFFVSHRQQRSLLVQSIHHQLFVGW